MPTAQQEIEQGRRFAFGRNWESFLHTLDDGRIAIAEQSLRDLLNTETLTGRTFLDVGGGQMMLENPAARAYGVGGMTSYTIDGVQNFRLGSTFWDYQTFDEVLVQTTGVDADRPTKGVRVTAVVKSGGNARAYCCGTPSSAVACRLKRVSVRTWSHSSWLVTSHASSPTGVRTRAIGDRARSSWSCGAVPSTPSDSKGRTGSSPMTPFLDRTRIIRILSCIYAEVYKVKLRHAGSRDE